MFVWLCVISWTISYDLCFWCIYRISSNRSPGFYSNNSVRPPASIRTTQFTYDHVFKTLRLLVLYLLLQSEIPGDVQLALWYSSLDPRLVLETRLLLEEIRYLLLSLMYFVSVMHLCILIFTFKSTIAYSLHCNWNAIVMLEIKALLLLLLLFLVGQNAPRKVVDCFCCFYFYQLVWTQLA